MKLVEPAELSAYLDGELDPTRAREEQAILADDAALRAQFDALQAADHDWRGAADSAIFAPDVQFTRTTLSSVAWLGMAAILVALVTLRMLPKIGDALAWGVALHGIALAVMLGWVARMARERPSRWRG